MMWLFLLENYSFILKVFELFIHSCIFLTDPWQDMRKKIWNLFFNTYFEKKAKMSQKSHDININVKKQFLRINSQPA